MKKTSLDYTLRLPCPKELLIVLEILIGVTTRKMITLSLARMDRTYRFILAHKDLSIKIPKNNWMCNNKYFLCSTWFRDFVASTIESFQCPQQRKIQTIFNKQKISYFILIMCTQWLNGISQRKKSHRSCEFIFLVWKNWIQWASNKDHQDLFRSLGHSIESKKKNVAYVQGFARYNRKSQETEKKRAQWG